MWLWQGGASARLCCLRFSGCRASAPVRSCPPCVRAALALLVFVLPTSITRSSCYLALQDMKDPEDVREALKATTCDQKYPAGVNVSVSRRPSTLLDFEERSLTHVLRASPHYYNTEEQVLDFLAAVRKVMLQV